MNNCFMRSVGLTIPTFFLSNILSANESVSRVNQPNTDGFWTSPLIVAALTAMLVIFLLVMVRAAVDVLGLYMAIKKASRREAALIKYH